MTDEEVPLAAAVMLVRRFGEGAQLWVALRIGELAYQNDADGILFWKLVAGHIDRILRPGTIQ
jgi:hypothetical protein